MNKSSSNSSSADDSNTGNSSAPSNGTTDTPSSSTENSTVTDNPLVKPNRSDPSSLGIPESELGTYFDSTKWLDWTDFNVTYTNVLVGGLPIMVPTINTLFLMVPGTQ
jgi:glucan 1,3-beta-glucosidase